MREVIEQASNELEEFKCELLDKYSPLVSAELDVILVELCQATGTYVHSLVMGMATCSLTLARGNPNVEPDQWTKFCFDEDGDMLPGVPWDKIQYALDEICNMVHYGDPIWINYVGEHA